MASVSVRRGGSVRDVTAALVDSSGGVIPIASEFLSYVSLRGCSPNRRARPAAISYHCAPRPASRSSCGAAAGRNRLYHSNLGTITHEN